MEFCGREQELETLKDRWKLASDVENPQPQVVVIAGEQGLGKTRLAMEFFKWLSLNEDVPETGYWSDDAGTNGSNLLVQPRSHLGSLRERPIPFLWWGIRVEDSTKENAVPSDALSRSPQELERNLAALTLRSRYLMKRVKREWSEFFAAILKQAASELPGVSLVTTIREIRGTIRKKGREFLDDIRRETSATYFEDEAKKSRETQNDALLATLEDLFSPKSKGYAKKPAVILIDDAQFFMNDLRISSFAARLMHSVVSQKWPVMILVTHWRRELHAKVGPFATILSDAQTNTGSRDKYDLPTGYLTSENLKILDLKPVDNLTRILVAELPGLSSGQTERLANQAAGHPRHLDQIVKFLKERPSHFEGGDVRKALTDDAMQKVERVTANLVDTVASRLRTAPEDVQKAVCIASMFGVRFVEQLVDAVGVRHIDWKSPNALAEAIDPYSWIRADNDTRVLEFSDRLFYLAALEHRRDMREFADTEALNKTIKAIIKEQYSIVLTDQAFRARTKAALDRLEELGMSICPEERAANIEYRELVLSIAENIFDGDDSEPDIEFWFVHHRLRSYDKDTDRDHVARDVRRALEIFEAHPRKLQELAPNEVVQISTVLRRLEMLDDAWQILLPKLQFLNSKPAKLRVWEDIYQLNVMLIEASEICRADGNRHAERSFLDHGRTIWEAAPYGERRLSNMLLFVRQIATSFLEDDLGDEALAAYLLLAEESNAYCHTQEYNGHSVYRAKRALGDGIDLALKISDQDALTRMVTSKLELDLFGFEMAGKKNSDLAIMVKEEIRLLRKLNEAGFQDASALVGDFLDKLSNDYSHVLKPASQVD